MSLESQFGDGACHLDILQQDNNEPVCMYYFALRIARSNGCPRPLQIISKKTAEIEKQGINFPDEVAGRIYSKDHLRHNIWWSYIVNESAKYNSRLVEDLINGVEEFDPTKKPYDRAIVPNSYLRGFRKGLARDNSYEITSAIVAAIDKDEIIGDNTHSNLFQLLQDINELIQGSDKRPIPVRSLNELHLSLLNRGWILTES